MTPEEHPVEHDCEVYCAAMKDTDLTAQVKRKCSQHLSCGMFNDVDCRTSEFNIGEYNRYFKQVPRSAKVLFISVWFHESGR